MLWGSTIGSLVARKKDLTFGTALKTAKLLDQFNNQGPFTVFAPTDDELEARLREIKKLRNNIKKLRNILKAPTDDELAVRLRDIKKLQNILKAHVVQGTTLLLDSLNEGAPEVVETLHGGKLTIKKIGTKIHITLPTDDKDYTVNRTMWAKNGVIYLIEPVPKPRKPRKPCHMFIRIKDLRKVDPLTDSFKLRWRFFVYIHADSFVEGRPNWNKAHPDVANDKNAQTLKNLVDKKKLKEKGEDRWYTKDLEKKNIYVKTFMPIPTVANRIGKRETTSDPEIIYKRFKDNENDAYHVWCYTEQIESEVRESVSK